jgi:hypothetical protein
LKKPTGLVRFWFYKPKTEPNPNWKKPEKNRAKPKKTEPKQNNWAKTEPNWFEPVFVLKNRIEPNRNRSIWTGFNSVLVFFKKKIWFSYFFWIKTEPNRKWSLLVCRGTKVFFPMPHDING